ncbi:MAG: DUF2934 domain-containing protein [Nitrospira sp.]|nr:DUF2934 domain-containing protein [Nitrospira sp.]MDH4369849.1 DUF2934 domain-containing protein [Nitrospira sp.]MDH5497281.1 DUF2934 domain-containing protein [Nitrospira sp.]MDH5726356.1 DUF2934 domain-containing protein [Nitrospira sp.]
MRTSVKSASKGKAKSSSLAGAIGKPIELPDGMWDRISQKAYELWEQRGCQEGNALRDWLDAEEIVMEEIHEARE